MVTYQRIKNNPTIFRYFTGLTVSEFEKLLPEFKKCWDIFVFNNFIKGKKRKRAYGAGNTPRLASVEDKLVFILSYFRIYPLHIVASLLFDLDIANINRWIHRLTPILEETLGHKCLLPARTPKALETILMECPEINHYLIDGTERKIQRPKDSEKQKKYYSGKKKTHTIKNILLSNKDNQVRFLTTTYEGKLHDKKAAEQSVLFLPKNSLLIGDLGFQGLFPSSQIKLLIPNKKPKGGCLTNTQKQQNKIISSIRVKIEHVIRGVKLSRIVSDTLRSYKQDFADTVMEIACGLHNLRTKERFCYNYT